MTEKRLGKISYVKFGHVGYQDVMLGLEIGFEWPGGGVGPGQLPGVTWDPNLIDCSKHAQWSEEDRDEALAKHMRYISNLLAEAKVKEIYQLKGIPVEIEVEDNTFKSFRILTEVL